MPIINKSTYPGAPWYQFNGHLQTIIPTSLRKIPGIDYQRERLELPDGDFLDLDWLDAGSNELVILSHGLESSSDRTYIRGMAKFFRDQHWDVLAWNCRSCSGEINRNFRLYYHGDAEDIESVINHAIATKNYKRIVLIGFSMGGNMTLKYAGLKGKEIPNVISHALAFSTPCDLKACIEEVSKPQNQFYSWYFFKKLRLKIAAKAAQFPEKLDITNLDKVNTWDEFDSRFSAPLNGLSSAEEFYYEASSKNFMAGTTIPTLVVNAVNDPMLDSRSSPLALAKDHPHLHLEVTQTGGHVGFAVGGQQHFWSEARAWAFCHA